jgi:hypothetical protein
MPTRNDQLAAIKKEIAAANQRVEEQLGRIATLAQDGHDTLAAMGLLVRLEQGVRILQEHQRYIEDRISREESD